MTAFDELYDMHRTGIFGFACALTGDAREAEDLFQETWLRAFRAWGAGSGPRRGEDKAWLLAIAANANRDILRKRRVRRLFLRERARSMGEATADADLGWDAPGRTGEDGATRSDIRLCLRRALARLPARERRVFILKDIEGLKHAEIAGILGIPEATVRTLLHRAVKRLRRELSAFRSAGETRPVFEEGRP